MAGEFHSQWGDWQYLPSHFPLGGVAQAVVAGMTYRRGRHPHPGREHVAEETQQKCPSRRRRGRT